MNLEEEFNNQTELRKTLIKIRTSLKEGTEEEKNEMIAALQQKKMLTMLLDTFHSEDAKVRKNAALIFEVLTITEKNLQEKVQKTIWDCYQKEETLFVRSSYLKALRTMKTEEYKAALEKRLLEMKSMEADETVQKHMREERREIERLLAKDQKKEAEVYREPSGAFEVLLTAQKCVQEILAAKMGPGSRMTPLGVRLHAVSIRKIEQNRLYQEALFIILQRKNEKITKENMAQGILSSQILAILSRFYPEKKSVFFRMEIRGKKEYQPEGTWIRRICYEIEEKSDGKLRNVPEQYDCQFIFAPKTDGSFVFFLKIPEVGKKRFLYRQYAEPTSMAPYAAAQVAALIAPYLTEDANVMDPFCGVGTLLIERALMKKTGDIYGTDVYGQAIEKARKNAKAAGQTIFFINRNFFDFTTEKPFDEILCEFPDLFQKTAEEADLFYKRFFEKAADVTTKHAMLFLVSNEENRIKKYIRLFSEYTLIKEIPFRKRTAIYIIERHNKM